MMKKNKKLIIFGASAFAEIAFEYFMHDSKFEVVAFTVSDALKTKDTLNDLPIVPFETIEERFPPSNYEIFIALVYNQLNRNRIKFYDEAISKGYKLASYISSKAFVWHNVEIGDNTFIFENNTIQPFVKIGSNNIFWSGNHIGHHSQIGSHNFISSQVVISGFCTIGNANFFGVNSTIGNNLSIGTDCFLGSFTHITENVESGTILKGIPSKAMNIKTWKLFNIEKI